MDETPQGSTTAPLLSARARVALWVGALALLGATFFAYDQAALAIQWVVMKLC
jgi:hypothetical protein